MARNDVAIYSPEASALYERDLSVTGGAEQQTVMLAEQLAARGLRSAHVVLPVETVRDLPARLEVVQRGDYAGPRKLIGKPEETRRVWRFCRDADAHTYVIRGAWPALGVVAAFCGRYGRRLVFACSSDRNFYMDAYARGLKRIDIGLFKRGARRSDAIVAQTGHQVALAQVAFPSVGRIIEIPSFAETAELSTAEPEAFLWTGRLIDYKNPHAYVELARAVPEARFWMIPKFVDEDVEAGRWVTEAARELPNLELLDQRPRPELMALVGRSVAIVNTSPREGMPNLFLEGWARGIPALSFEFDPDGRIADHGLGEFAEGSPERFAQAARELWEGRGDRAALSKRVRSYLEETHSFAAVADRWMELLEALR